MGVFIKNTVDFSIVPTKLELLYTELQGQFYMLQLISIDSRHFKVVLEGFNTRFRKLRICVIWVNTIDFKVALYISPNHTDFGIHSDHGYLATLEQPSRATLRRSALKSESRTYQSTTDPIF